MGQRLNIEIKKDSKVLANAYYHQGNSIYFPEITICSTLGFKAAI